MTYDKTTIYKMTRDRHVRKDEAEAISEITGYPLIPGDEASDLHRRLQELSPKNRRIVEQLIHALELEQGASDQ
ncbi:hypothetical protein [Cereibacter johrii]|uniref:Uncharacterized protein n=1 Tax=Cereibacter johrii TaxID=445629 RepID=A0ABX5JC84_9RHOB|nr:hypothetical protein [Cereibacter johrii]PTM81073.1 hypothetical protein C8J29_1015 [Cereibacter johrii]